MVLKEFKSTSGRYYMNYPDFVGTGVVNIIPAFILGMAKEEFLIFIEKAGATILCKDTPIYFWEDLEDLRKVKNLINRKARERKITNALVESMLQSARAKV